MLRSAKDLMGYVLQANDGELGRCKDFLFDDDYWTVRYMVANTKKWLPGRKVLISPIALQAPEWSSRTFPVDLSQEQIRNSPALDEDAPVSRRYEARYYRHFSLPMYWGGTAAWGATAYPAPLLPGQPAVSDEAFSEADGDKHLRSVHEISGYYLHARDGELGHVDDCIINDEKWSIEYVVVDTANWLPGRKVLIAPSWAEEISWSESKLRVGLTREEVKASPPYDPNVAVNREYETRLYDYYGRPHGWS